MKLIKKINNNFALALDGSGKEIIVSGRGIGFIQMPCELTDLSLINRTYYDIDSKYIGLLNEVDEKIIDVSVKTYDYAKSIVVSAINPNLTFTLADHINFAIQRINKGYKFEFPLNYDFKQVFKIEIEVGKYALELLKRDLGIVLPEEEINSIAMNIINAEINPVTNNSNDFEKLISYITKIVENYFKIEIDRNSFNYTRYATHLRYLFTRINDDKSISSENLYLFETVIKELPQTYECVKNISEYLKVKKKWNLSQEEELYLILHVNRVCAKEGL